MRRCSDQGAGRCWSHKYIAVQSGLFIPILSAFHPFIIISAVWLRLHAALLLFAANSSGEAGRAALPTRRERYFYNLDPFASGKKH